MANVKISELPLGNLTQTSTFPFVDAGTTYQGAISAITSNSTVEVTYSDLQDRVNGGGLTTGTYYIITDFRTCYDQPDFDVNGNAITGDNYKQASIDPIVVFATGTNSLSTEAYQPSYPNDRIQYDVYFSQTEVTGGDAYGRITERIDEFGNRTDYDHRTIQFKRYRYYSFDITSPADGIMEVVSTSESEMSVSGTGTNFTSLSVGDYIGFQAEIGFQVGYHRAFEITSIVSDTEMYITGLTSVSLSDVYLYPSVDEGYQSPYQNNILTTDFTEYYTFDYDYSVINNYVGNYSNEREWNETTFILSNNVFKNGNCINNVFQNSCYNNTISNSIRNNKIGDYFYNNIFLNNFSNNVIGSEFNNNKIQSDFYENKVDGFFTNNYIYQAQFSQNKIQIYFQYNKICGGNFTKNTISTYFTYNSIKESFYENTSVGNTFNGNIVAYSFYDNLIRNEFNDNTIYSEFNQNEIGNYFQDNLIGDINNIGSNSFSENIIGEQFENNTIIQDFYKNHIGIYFNNNGISGYTTNNVIGNIFQENTIYDYFRDNRISDEFKSNMILDSFEGNSVKSYVGGNQFSGGTYLNNIGFLTFGNDFLGLVVSNTWGDWFYGNNIGDGFQQNTIGNFFNGNNIGDNFGYGYSTTQGNKIGNNFFSNIIGEYFYNNSIPDNFYDNQVGDYFQWNVINTNIDTTNFTFNYGNITGFSYTATGTSAVDNLYIGIEICGTTQSMGTGATFDIEVSGGSVIGVSGNTEGRLYKVDDILTISGTQIGGVHNVIVNYSNDGIGKNGVDGSYPELSVTGGSGTNANFDVNVSGGLVDSVSIYNVGTGYEVGDSLTILGSQFGGVDGVDNITITVDSIYTDDVVITVTGVTSGSLFYEHYTKQIFERKLGDKRVSYYDENDILNIDSIYEASGYIPVYSQSLSFPINYTSVEFKCDGGYTNTIGYTGNQTNSTQDVVSLFNSYFRSFGYFFDNNDGKIGIYINPSLKKQWCSSGTYTIYVFND